MNNISLYWETNRALIEESIDSSSTRDSLDSLKIDINPTSVEIEPNDTFAQAEATDIEPGESTEYSASAEIGNNPNIEAELDVDLYEVELAANQLLKVDTDGLSNDLFLTYRLFDQQGNEVTIGGSYTPLNFWSSTAGTYYLGVSGESNYDYNPNEEGSGSGGSTGTYEIGITTEVVEITETEPNDILTQAEATEIAPGGATEFTATAIIGNNPNIEPGLDVDLYEVELAANELLRVDTDRLSDNLFVEYRLFDAEGNEVTIGGSYTPLNFLASTPGTYYLGVSTTYNYDPNEEGSGEFQGETGPYELEMNTRVIEVTETEPNDILTQAEATEIAPGGATEFTNIAVIGNNSNLKPEQDVDLYKLEVTAAQFIIIKTESIVSDLNSHLRIFDAQGNELAASNNYYYGPLARPLEDDAYTSDSRSVLPEFSPPLEDDAHTSDSRLMFPIFSNSLLVFPVLEAGTYYIGVSSSDNSEYDPNEEGSGADGYTSGLYEIQINARNQIIGTPEPDLLTGTAQIDVIKGLGANDVIEGNQDNDILFGGEGNDVISGGEGHDSIEGENNNDSLLGEAGNDTIFGGNGNDVISGSDGEDQLSGESGNDVISGGDGYDGLVGDHGNDLLIGGSGGDYINAGDGNDTLIGIDPDNLTEYSDDYDNLVGGDGRDTFILGDSDRVYNIYTEEEEIYSSTTSITDFSPTADFVQLHGSASDYRLQITGLDVNLIYQPADITIATLQGAPRDLSLTAPTFVYV